MSQHEKKYHDAQYWDQRYINKPEQFDWYYTYADLIPQISFVLKPKQRFLCIGNGNSTFPIELYESSFEIKDIIATDISKTVIDYMLKQHKPREGLVFEYDDATNSVYDSNSFDVAFDKGCVDSLSTCGQDIIVQKFVDETHRVLKVGGYFLMVSFGLPYQRLHLFKQDKWDVGVRKLKETEYNEEDYFCYFCKKI
ncbi:Endothelin-converting_enzyme 2 [Hexamita inflata]|uniref:Endothelin-converting enzyme 2 n=1 Tax=Hexamita inflata TaxID=28002 RepID=A0AA86RJ42_9EUKA|nr:Endothelin-converting enzyme 2 [Hexamita inflata]